MKALLLFASFALGLPVWASQVDFTCHSKFYQCNPAPDGSYYCQWQTNLTEIHARVDLTPDPNYPNPSYPYHVSRARFWTTYDNHTLTLDIVSSDHDQVHPLQISAHLDARTVIAESSGTDQVDVALRNQNYGRGFFCTNFRLIP